MSFALPIVALALRSTKRAENAAARLAPDHDVERLRPELTDALLGDAMLDATDLPQSWARAGGTRSALFGGTEYAALCIADARVSFRRDDGAVIEQQIGVLPRWAARLHRLQFDSFGVHDPLLATPASRGRTTLPPMPVEEPQMTVRVAIGEAAATPGETVFLRRGSLVMALAYRPSAPDDDQPRHLRELTEIADEKWTALAEALR